MNSQFSSGVRPHSSLRPDGEFVAGRVQEMKPPSAWERKRRFADLTSRRFDLLLNGRQVACVKHNQHAMRWRRPVCREAARKTAVEKAGVIRTIILELPSEHSAIELFGPREITSGEFNVVDLFFRFLCTHGPDSKKGRAARIVNIGQVYNP